MVTATGSLKLVNYGIGNVKVIELTKKLNIPSGMKQQEEGGFCSMRFSPTEVLALDRKGSFIRILW